MVALKQALAVTLVAVLLCSVAVAQPTQYVGNTKSHVFHKLSCRYAGCKNCTKVFSSRDEAIAAGYRPGGCCHP